MKLPGQNVAVIGAQWGDEGKGKIVDLLCEHFDVVARFQGGHNAGHTVKFADRHYSLHLIPSGILHPGKLCILGNGMVIDPQALLDEMKSLGELGVTFDGNLKISESAHCILPYHRALDVAREESAGKAKIGTTGRGIGPAYETKVSRYGICIGDLLDPAILKQKIEFACSEKNSVLTTVYGKEGFDPQELVDQYLRFGELLGGMVENTVLLINDLIRDGKKVMFEGAQGSLLDIDHGTYPYVTSSNCVVGGISTGLGVAPRHINGVIAVAKAYTTRVGGGPFPTELLDKTGDHLRARGNEYGTTTGRPRRCGWLDLPILRTTAMLNGIDQIALTKIDVFDELEEIQVCVGYKVRGTSMKTFPRYGVNDGDYRPEYRAFKGWQRSTVGTGSFEELPQQAQDYIAFVEDELETPVSIISTGPRREETILR
ncbi:MAG TPA: adenylosuccinate synthase [Thermoanaerobaculia bacterium]|nr:adenylosuccinate synthase [Thermoanaerobaculia bacterium]